MAYKIKLNHNIDGKSFPITLHYNDSNSTNPDITINNVTSTPTEFNLVGWDNVDASKIQIIECDKDEETVIYHFKNENAHFETQ